MQTVNILVATDCQVDFCNGALGTKEAQASVPAIVRRIEKGKAEGESAIVTMDTHGKNYLETNEGKHLPFIHTVKDTDGWNIVPEISQALAGFNLVFLEKSQFGTLDIIEAIRNIVKDIAGNDFDEANLKITFIGWCTDICVISNVLIVKAAFPEAQVIVESACCAGVTPEAHEAALTVMKSCQVEVI